MRSSILVVSITSAYQNNNYCSLVGQGAYGMVVAARDKRVKEGEGQMIAIKKIEKAFEHKIFTKRTLRELKILRLLNHENVSDYISFGLVMESLPYISFLSWCGVYNMRHR